MQGFSCAVRRIKMSRLYVSTSTFWCPTIIFKRNIKQWANIYQKMFIIERVVNNRTIERVVVCCVWRYEWQYARWWHPRHLPIHTRKHASFMLNRCLDFCAEYSPLGVKICGYRQIFFLVLLHDLTSFWVQLTLFVLFYIAL